MQTLTQVQDEITRSINSAREGGVEADADWAFAAMRSLGCTDGQALSAFSQAREMADLEWDADCG